MPNWVFNGLTIEGNPELVNDLVKQMNKPFVMLHDSWNATSGKMEVTQTTYPNPVFAFYNIFNHRQAGISDKDYLAQPPRDMPIEEQMQFKTNDWYSFNVREWGTKWDVAVSDDDKYPETELVEYKSEGDDNWVIYKYNTAWSPAVTILTKLSLLVPNSLLTLEFEEEQGWGGEYEILRGEVTENLEYDNRCYACQSFNCIEYCDNGCGEFCLECNEGSWQDEEAMKECQTHAVQLAETKG